MVKFCLGGLIMFCIKKSLMEKILTKKKKKQPFDYAQAESFTLNTAGDGTFNNSYYFSAHSQQKKQSLYTRLGLRDDKSAEVWVFFCDNDKTYTLKDMLFNTENSPLKVTNSEKGWGFTFEGKLTDNDGNEFNANLSCDFISDREVVDFFQHMPTARTATAIAQEKWTKQFFADVQQNNSVHYEQEGVIKGSLTIGEQVFEIDLPCLRDHSYGRRVWGYMNNHIWLACVDENCAFNFSMVSYPSISVLEVGHLHLSNKPVEFVTKAHYDRNEIVKGTVPENLSLELTIDNSRTIPLEIKLLHYTPYVFENGAYTLNEGIAELTLDGVKYRGILEIGFNKDSSRFMNGKKIDKIIE